MAGDVLEHDWFPAPLPEHVTIGDDSWVYSSFAFIHDVSLQGIVIGQHTGVYNGTFFDLGPQGSVEIGDYCTIVGAIFSTNGPVVIRDYAFVAHEVLIADEDFATPASSASGRSESRIVIGENAWIGARAVLLAGADIGRDAVVGAGTVVDGPVPDGAVVAGSPFRVIGSTS
jgi:acetyltransferase-like isoleucine patch superfamily enzyme